MEFFTLGHSTRSFEEFLSLLRENGVRALADIRTMPKSKFVPQFNEEKLGPALRAAGVAYLHIKALGGLRKPGADSANLGWKNKSFRGYADYMQTEPFEKGLEELAAAAQNGPLAYMCAESVPWRCHRNLVSDVLTARGHKVFHIMGPGKTNPHKLTPFARVREGRVLYPEPEDGEHPQQEEMW